MNDLGSLVKSTVDTAFDAQRRGPAPAGADVRERVVRRGRRRRAARIVTSAVLSVVVVAGAASATTVLLRRDAEIAAPEVPDMGAEKVFGLGGVITSDGEALWIGSGATSNDAGDRNGISRLDIATEQSVDGPPAVELPQAMAAGGSGIWTVSWHGDMPVGGEGSPVRGAIERVDPVTLERTGHIAREDSAPYDVAAGVVDGTEVAWVVDAGSHELLRVDGGSFTVSEVYDAPRTPVSVLAHGPFVYVTSSDEHVVVRMDAETGATTRFDVPKCANEAAVGGGALWVTDSCGDALHRIDEESGDVVASFDLPRANGVAYAEGLVWVATDGNVVRVDPGTNEVVGNRIYVGEMVDGLLYAGGSMWAQSWDGVYRLDEDVPPATPPPTPSPTPDPRAEPLPPGVERVEVARDPAVLETGAGSLWTGMFEIERLDPATGEVEAEIDPRGIVEAMDYDEAAGILWALVEVPEKETSALIAVDPATNELALGPVLLDPPAPYEQALAAHDGVAWVAGLPTVWRVELATGDVARIDIDRHLGGPDETSGFNVAATESAVLVVPVNGTVIRIDPETFATEEVGDLGWNVGGLVTDGETVWLVQNSGETSEILLWTLDGDSGQVVGEPVVFGEFGAEHIAHHNGLVWIAQSGLNRGGVAVKAYEQGTGDPVHAVEVRGAPFAQGAAAGPEGFWITTGNGFLYKIAPD